MLKLIITLNKFRLYHIGTLRDVTHHCSSIQSIEIYPSGNNHLFYIKSRFIQGWQWLLIPIFSIINENIVQ